MKTADLIPLILYELAECDKYGFELTKNIETKSKGKIIIKQPTLYTLLKKLEKSKFISSYWEDSEIGGKRHYYKITDNGRAQLSTLPTYNEIINSIVQLDSDGNEVDTAENINEVESIDNTISSVDISEEPSNIDLSSNDLPEEKHISIMEALSATDTSSQEDLIPSETVFDNDNVDTITELEANTSNSDMLQPDNTFQDNQFAENKDVAAFTEKVNVPEEYKSQFKDNTDLVNSLDLANYSPKINDEPIKYVEYVDFRKSEIHKVATKTAKNLVFISFLTSLYLIAMLAINAIVCATLGTSPFYYVCIITGSLCAFFYPLTVIGNFNNLKIKFLTSQYYINFRKRILISTCIFVLITIIILIVNICSKYNLFNISNFANFYGPILLSSTLFANFIISLLIFRKVKN